MIFEGAGRDWMLIERLKQSVSPKIRLQGSTPYSLVLERASGTHKYSVRLLPGLLTSTCSVVCLFPQAHSNKLRLAALEAPVFHSLWCLAAQRKGMVIKMDIVDVKGRLHDSRILSVISHSVYRPSEEKLAALADKFESDKDIRAFAYDG